MLGIELNEKLALFYAEYRAGDHLLCHDDELEGRRVAFILYLAPHWTEADGGHLDLFDVGRDGS
jgi:Rps23 Pro-64 3,4-dihydroxylase Tpa1-like proline 4-hydroxylase